MLRKILLACGILSSLLYSFEINVLAPLRYPGYSSKSQVPSELFAIDAPANTALFRALGTAYVVLLIAFGIGVWQSADKKRSLRVTGVLLTASAVVGYVGSFFPMHQREVLAAGGATLSDTMHQIIYGAIASPIAFLYIGFAAFAIRYKWFRIYSVVTILILFSSGALLAMDSSKIGRNEPTPWVGVNERILIAAYMMWIIVLAIVLWRPKNPRLVGEGDQRQTTSSAK